jgi:peroxiredoxin
VRFQGGSMTTPNPIDESIADRFAQHKARIAGMSFPNALAVGDRAPDFELGNAAGHPVRLTELLTHGPVVLTFYRGAWCPYCNAQLRGLQQALPELEALGASLVAVSPQLPDGSAELIDEAALTFEVLSDVESRVAAEYGILFTLAPVDRALFLEVGNDLGKANGDGNWVLPAPSTFVIAADATIHHARVDPDFTSRIAPDEILSALRMITT